VTPVLNWVLFLSGCVFILGVMTYMITSPLSNLLNEQKKGENMKYEVLSVDELNSMAAKGVPFKIILPYGSGDKYLCEVEEIEEDE